MSCEFFERHFAHAGSTAELDEHLSTCADCRQVSADMIRLAEDQARLTLPSVPPALWDRWKSVPSRALPCDRATESIARRIGEPLEPALSAALDRHLARCEDCRETASVLGVTRDLRPASPERLPSAPNVVPAAAAAVPEVASLAEARERRRRPAWTDPRLYAAAACLLAGVFTVVANAVGPAGPASFLGSLGREVRVRTAEASERFGIWEEQLSRRVVATRETLTGYTKAAEAIVLTAAGRAAEGILAEPPKREKGTRS